MPNKPSEALKFLKQAEESTKELCSSDDATIGYGMVINTFRM